MHWCHYNYYFYTSQLTRRTFFETDLHDQKKEEEERALLQAEERERESRDKEKQPQNKKLTKPVSSLKSVPSPRMEHRKGGSQTSLGPGTAGSSVGGLSPGLAHRSIGQLNIYFNFANADVSV